MRTGRIESLDFLRGTALLFTLFFHASIYNYANIDKLDFSRPPMVVVVMSFMALWGGIFIILSMVVNTLMVLRRQDGGHARIFRYLIIASVLYFACHYLLTIALGRWNIDFVNNQPDLTIVAGTLRNMQPTMAGFVNWASGSSLSTIAANLAVLSTLLFVLLKNERPGQEKRDYLILGIAGAAIMLASFARVSLYGLYAEAKAAGDLVWGSIWSVLLANPYPLLPYLAYGMFGALIGMMLYRGQNRLLRWAAAPAGALFLAYGVWGMLGLPKTISKPDYFWYFKTNAELGIFLLLISLCLWLEERGAARWGPTALVKWIGRISLTIYMLETTVSEIARKVGLAILPSWNQTIEGCLIFGGINVILWAGIVILWKKVDFRYSLEYFWVSFFAKIGKDSSKLADLPTLGGGVPRGVSSGGRE